MSRKRAAIILAAGKGKRMKSDLPKVLHRIGDKSMIRYVMETVSKLDFGRIAVIVGHKGEMVIEELSDFDVDFVWQERQLGTGHAVLMAEDKFKEFDGTILVAAGDVPLLSAETIENLFEVHLQNEASATCLSASFEDATGYGRIIREPDSNVLLDIIEEKDADSETREIREINTGTFCFDGHDLFSALKKVGNENAQREYYLTDTIRILRQANKRCAVWMVADPVEVSGINSVEQLKSLENELKKTHRNSPKDSII